MYVLKHIPEDFIVNEHMSPDLSGGAYALFLLEKKNLSTMDALQRLSAQFRKPLRDFGFAGNKDKKAVTKQYLSIFNGRNEDADVVWDDLRISYLGQSSGKIALGMHTKNEFRITIRNLEDRDVEKLKKFAFDTPPVPNYYGPQRFSEHNHLIGRHLVKKNFREAAALIQQSNSGMRQMQDAISTLRTLPKPLLSLYIHAYQSFLFNTALHRVHNAQQATTTLSLPLIGFGYEEDSIDNEMCRAILSTLLRNEHITPRDFIIPQMPELTSEGEMREAYFSPEKFTITSIGPDDAFEGRKKAVVEFSLKPSCYATTLLSFILQECKDILHD